MLRAAFIASLLAALAGGCGTAPVAPDAGPPGEDGMAGDTDSNTAASMLRFVFTSDPKVPGDAGGDQQAKIETLVVELEDIRTISDNGSPTLPSLALDWGDEYSEDEIFLDFEDAPPGIYSRLRAQIDSISVTGTVELNDVVYDYIISGEPQNASIAVDLTSVMISKPSMISVPIEVGIRDAVRSVDWLALESTAIGNTIILPDDLIDDFAAALADSFEQDD